ncbi:cupin domain-containing protein [Halorussus vallis]|uniref:cupin domain-containing protein n=2 Tax=Halorussus TaxID=1070314 RepID=UPI0020A226A6|nr:cupin domain-containing protein [Halorussus vallis]USZ73870.1 cupin domain-containing protein [Halorussus vallis]
MEDSDRIVAADDREWESTERGDHEFRRVRLGAAAGGERLGCSLYEVPPGKKVWPYHYHIGNEEAAYILSGEVTLRTPEGETTVPPGGYVALPAGEDSAHQFRNDGDEPLRFLAISEMNDPDVLGYPDSGKVGVYAGSPPGGDPADRVLSGFFPEDADVDFWEGEADEE